MWGGVCWGGGECVFGGGVSGWVSEFWTMAK